MYIPKIEKKIHSLKNNECSLIKVLYYLKKQNKFNVSHHIHIAILKYQNNNILKIRFKFLYFL